MIKVFKINMHTGSSSRLKMVDHNETYGCHILDSFSKFRGFKNVLDIGCGAGSDLLVVKKCNNKANLTGIDFGNWNQEKLSKNNINLINLDIEKDKLPFESTILI
ncbi:class I SAM-dependent methyltransferase [Francisella tularensis]|uniref:class I SAM-dependent methyltransferase n=1 Tax=Francisella tularensis TaxID=263 RepID=UPI001E59EFC0|nr:class I SAM-dependent methyltransferase [Francisella tularensis]MDE4940150.1 class I SAM-dependent methyltransferase [Francisella tularensis subsp. holarctica]MDE4965350.1 class I SAM-dependent methyltransferase [Francisella tularensis subsp. holarctica]MDE5024044.1 class I SAM-dependent methyltransferase [Francisella tularensis subsp. holarctica]MDE5025846.1 class I SAM-dependent methyltransferase [Francisella tularensis subsp. holarctica]MDE5027521.1 class I SAM-dependent methyltransferas